MKMVAPIMSEEKAAFVRRQLLSTLLGGAKISPEMTARAYLAQGVVWVLPPVLAIVAALVLASQPVGVRLLVGGMLGTVFCAVVELGRWAVCRSGTEDREPAVKAAWFADYDEVDFSRLLDPATCRVLLPPKRSKLHLLLSLVLSFGLVGVAAGVLDMDSMREDLGEGESAAAVVLTIFCSLSVAAAHFGLVAAPPVEVTSHRLHDPLTVGGLLADFSRPLLLLGLLLATLAELPRPAGAVLRIVAALLPLLWATGIVPQLDTLGSWVLEQAEVHLFGGSPLPLGGATLAGDVRLAIGVIASAAAAAAVALVPAAVQDGDSHDLPAILAAVVGLPLAVLLSTLPPRPFADAGLGLARHVGMAGVQAILGLALGLALLLSFGGADSIQASLDTSDRKADAAWLVRLVIEQGAVALCYVALYAISARQLRADIGALGLWSNGHNYRMVRNRLLWGTSGTKKVASDQDGGDGSAAAAAAAAVAARVARSYALLEAPARILLLAHAAAYGTVAFCEGGDAFGGTMGTAFEAAALLRAWRVVLREPPRAAVDAWIVGLVDLLLAASGVEASSGYPRWSLSVRIMLVSVVRARLRRLIAYAQYALHLARVTPLVPKLAHPLTGKVLLADVVFLPAVVLTLVLAAALESPLIALFTLPIFGVGYPRAAHGHPELSPAGQPLTKGVEGIFYSILAPSLLRGLAPRWRCGAVPATPGSMLFCRSHERLACVVRVLGAGLGWVQVEIRGLEMQEPTSCHHVEAGKIDDAFSSAFLGATAAGANSSRPLGGAGGFGGTEDGATAREGGDRDAESGGATAKLPGPFALRPICEVTAQGYEQTQLSLRGIIDNPETLRQVHGLFIKTLVWVMAKEIQQRGNNVPKRWLSCPLKPRDAQKASSLLFGSTWPQHLTDLLNRRTVENDHRKSDEATVTSKVVFPGATKNGCEEEVATCTAGEDRTEGTLQNSWGRTETCLSDDEGSGSACAVVPDPASPHSGGEGHAPEGAIPPASGDQASRNAWSESPEPMFQRGSPPVPPGTPPMSTEIRKKAGTPSMPRDGRESRTPTYNSDLAPGWLPPITSGSRRASDDSFDQMRGDITDHDILTTDLEPEKPAWPTRLDASLVSIAAAPLPPVTGAACSPSPSGRSRDVSNEMHGAGLEASSAWPSPSPEAPSDELDALMDIVGATQKAPADQLDALMDMVMDMAPIQSEQVEPAKKKAPVPKVIGATLEEELGMHREVPAKAPVDRDSPSTTMTGSTLSQASARPPKQLAPLDARGAKSVADRQRAAAPAVKSTAADGATATREECRPKGHDMQMGDLAQLVVQAYTAVDIAPACGQRPELLGSSHVFQIYTGQLLDKKPEVMQAGPGELRWLAEWQEVRQMTLKAFRYALKVTVDCVAMAEDASALGYSELDQAMQELEKEWHLGVADAPPWQAAMEEQVPNLMALRKKGTDVQVLRLCLREDGVRVGELRSEVVHSIWASESVEMQYFTNDDDERYSIQAHPTLFRNMIVQSAEYPIYVSPPTTVWL